MANYLNHTILIVEDAPENIAVLSELLKDYHLKVALNGEEALEIVYNEPLPDLILLDIMMDGMDGYEVCHRLKSDDYTQDVPIIFLTAMSETANIIRGFQKGAIDFVTKPFNAQELIARVSTHITLKRAQDLIAKHTKIIEQKNTLITDSINYAKRIQNAILPSEEYISTILEDFFVFFRPKDIVSGDFYWVRRIEDKVVVVVGDCTGHGVPGAFMSMFGVAFLNETIAKEKTTKPSVILDKLREKVMVSLGQENETQIKDGMDVAVVSIDFENHYLEYSGAYNPLYIVRDKKIKQVDADRMPVSIYAKMSGFTNHVVELKKDDQLYLFSDGYSDQFGGKFNKKLYIKFFKQLLLDNSKMSMKKQKENLAWFFEEWKGIREQTDDVVIFGIKI